MNLIANTLFLLTLIIHTLGTPTPEDANEAITAVELTTLNSNGHAFLGATGEENCCCGYLTPHASCTPGNCQCYGNYGCWSCNGGRMQCQPGPGTGKCWQ